LLLWVQGTDSCVGVMEPRGVLMLWC